MQGGSDFFVVLLLGEYFVSVFELHKEAFKGKYFVIVLQR